MTLAHTKKTWTIRAPDDNKNIINVDRPLFPPLFFSSQVLLPLSLPTFLPPHQTDPSLNGFPLSCAALSILRTPCRKALLLFFLPPLPSNPSPKHLLLAFTFTATEIKLQYGPGAR